MNACPPTLIVALRALPVLAAAAKVTVREDEPVAPPVTVSHVALLVADAVQPSNVVSAALPVAPPPDTDAELGDHE